MKADRRAADGAPAPKRAYRMNARRAGVEQTRQRILEATYALWLERPYDEVTLEAVAEAAGVSRQTVHRQFGSKEDLVLAVTAWRGPAEERARDVEPGDIDEAVRRVVARNEEMGDANVRALELEGRVEAVDHMLKHGRKSHRRWIEKVFAPRLPPPGSPAREPTILALYAATDVTLWKLLRRDFGRSRSVTEDVIRRLVIGALPDRDDAQRERKSKSNSKRKSKSKKRRRRS